VHATAPRCRSGHGRPPPADEALDADALAAQVQAARRETDDRTGGGRDDVELLPPRGEPADAVATVLDEARSHGRRGRPAAAATARGRRRSVKDRARTQTDDRGRRRQLHDLLLAKALDEELAELDPLAGDDERSIRETEADGEQRVAPRSRRRDDEAADVAGLRGRLDDAHAGPPTAA
jgi:hypothetical protein